MAKYFLIGEVGDGGMWLVDLERKSVERIEEEDIATGVVPEGDIIVNFNQARMERNNALYQGINLAVASSSRSGPSSHNRRA
jgi:hypothetical protein